MQEVKQMKPKCVNSMEHGEGASTPHRIHLGDGMTLSGLRRAISQVSMLVVKATTSGEAAWREECLKYAFFFNWLSPTE